MNNTKKNSKKFIIILLVVLLLGLAVGYAAFSDTLNITGTANAGGSFDLEFQNAQVSNQAGVDVDETTATISADKNTLTVKVADLSYPGAGAQFDVDIKNVGTVPAKVESVTANNITGDGQNIVINGLDAINTSHPTIDPNGVCHLAFTVEWDSTKTEAIDGETCSFELTINYVQDTTPFSGSASHVD